MQTVCLEWFVSLPFDLQRIVWRFSGSLSTSLSHCAGAAAQWPLMFLCGFFCQSQPSDIRNVCIEHSRMLGCALNGPIPSSPSRLLSVWFVHSVFEFSLFTLSALFSPAFLSLLFVPLLSRSLSSLSCYTALCISCALTHPLLCLCGILKALSQREGAASSSSLLSLPGQQLAKWRGSLACVQLTETPSSDHISLHNNTRPLSASNEAWIKTGPICAFTGQRHTWGICKCQQKVDMSFDVFVSRRQLSKHCWCC